MELFKTIEESEHFIIVEYIGKRKWWFFGLRELAPPKELLEYFELMRKKGYNISSLSNYYWDGNIIFEKARM